MGLCETCRDFFIQTWRDYEVGHYSKNLKKIITKEEFNKGEVPFHDFLNRIEDSCYNSIHLQLEEE